MKSINLVSFVALICLVVTVAGRPRYIAIPVEDIEFINLRPLQRVVREAVYEPAATYERIPVLIDPSAAASDSRPARQAHGGGHGDYVDYGAHTGHHGAFGWYADFPVIAHEH